MAENEEQAGCCGDSHGLCLHCRCTQRDGSDELGRRTLQLFFSVVERRTEVQVCTETRQFQLDCSGKTSQRTAPLIVHSDFYRLILGRTSYP
jgi:hypothetical protein